MKVMQIIHTDHFSSDFDYEESLEFGAVINLASIAT